MTKFQRPAHWPTRLTDFERSRLRDQVLRAMGVADRGKTGIDTAIEGGRRPSHWPELTVFDRSGERIAA